MKTIICKSKRDMAEQAAADGAEAIRAAIRRKGRSTIVVPTGASQIEMLAALVAAPDVEWDKVTAFHLDEYVGIPLSHPASFRRFLHERFLARLPRPLAAFHDIDGEADVRAECARLARLIEGHEVDVSFIGIGENGHLAFNDPPADFNTDQSYMRVRLDEACRRQQLGEGWFKSLDDVPQEAITMTVPQILKSGRLICSVPDHRKARAVKAALEGPLTPDVPASILRNHDSTVVFLEPESASLLSGAHAAEASR